MDPNYNPGNGSNQNPDYNQAGYNPYTDPNPNDFNYQQPQNPYQDAYRNAYNGYSDPELEKKANNIKTLGIVSVVTGVIFILCCTLVSPIIGIIGLVQANGLNASLNQISPQGQEKIRTGKLLCIIGIVLGVVGMLLSFLANALGLTDAFVEGFQEGLDEAQNGAYLILNNFR